MKHLEDVAPAHAVDALALILGLQATDPHCVDDGARPRRSGRPARRRLAQRDRTPVRRRSSPHRRPRVRRGLARPGPRRGAPGRARLARRERDPPLPLPGARRRAERADQRHRRSRAGRGVERASTMSSPPARWPRLPVLVEYAAPLLEPGGHFVAWKGAASPEETSAGAVAAGSSGWSRSRSSPSCRTRARVITPCTCSGRPARRPNGSRGARAWPPSARSARCAACSGRYPFHVKHRCRSDRPRR